MDNAYDEAQPAKAPLDQAAMREKALDFLNYALMLERPLKSHELEKLRVAELVLQHTQRSSPTHYFRDRAEMGEQIFSLPMR